MNKASNSCDGAAEDQAGNDKNLSRASVLVMVLVITCCRSIGGSGPPQDLQFPRSSVFPDVFPQYKHSIITPHKIQDCISHPGHLPGCISLLCIYTIAAFV